MLENNSRRAPGYWIQLTLAMGIATLGLVLSSTAVVIGAMLVSPLMGPILELGMGFAVGSAFLVLRASLRVLMSVIVVVGGAAVLTLALPFHEVTGEIAARTAPTALDLLVAVFCALTAAYTTVRSTSDTTSAAAGTAIGIALVPPLCVCGFGIGTGALSVAGGAALLFTANFSAILVFAVISFLLLGYNQVEAQTVEQRYVDDGTRTDKLAVRFQGGLRKAFGSRYSLAMRLIVPAVFLASVYVPLRRALNEVTWEVRARDAIRRILTEVAPRAVQTAITVERHTVSLHLVMIGSTDFATALEKTVREAVTEKTGVVPTVVVSAVPDAQTLAATTIARTASGKPGDDDAIDLPTLQQRMSSAIEAEWPTSAAGPLAGWELTIPSRAAPTVLVRHLGPQLGAAGQTLLASRWSARVGTTIQVADDPLETSTATAPLGGESAWLAAARPILEWVGKTERAVACLKAPISTDRRLTTAQRSALDAVRASAAGTAGRVTIADSAGWRLRVATVPCAPPDSANTTPSAPAPGAPTGAPTAK